MEPQLGYDYEAAATYLGITDRQIRNLKNRGEITYAKVGNQIRFSKKMLDDYVSKITTTATR